MVYRTGSMGNMLQGVSQQPDRVRLEGQVSTQINMLSDPSEGLSTRPSTFLGPRLLADLAPDDNYIFTNLQFRGDDYVIGYNDEEVHVWNTEGTEIPVTSADGVDITDYLGPTMGFYVNDGRIIVLNKERDTANSEEGVVTTVPQTWALVHCILGQFNNTYTLRARMTLSGNDVTRSYSYTTPNGTADGDAEATSSETIISRLAALIVADDQFTALNGQVETSGNVLAINVPGGTVNITTSDGSGGASLVPVNYDVPSPEDLPVVAPNGTRVRITSSNAQADDYYLRFNTQGDGDLNFPASFGTPGTWEESFSLADPHKWDASTLPHILEPSFTNGVLTGLEFNQADWVDRLIGDADSAPFPSFLGRPIRDIIGFEGRMAVMTEDTVVMSRTDEPFDFFRFTAVQTIATDPIDIGTSARDSLQLDFFVPFDRDLYAVSNTGNSQTIIRGGGLTPSNASLVITSEFDTSGGTFARPGVTGRALLFPFSYGRFSGLKEFSTSRGVNRTNTAQNLTDAQDRYIEGRIEQIAVNQNFNLVVMRSSENSRRLYVYRFLYDGYERVQSSWSIWDFQDDIDRVFFNDNLMYLIQTNGGSTHVNFMDLNRPVGEFGYHIMLDRERLRTATAVRAGVSAVTSFGPNFQYLQGQGCRAPGQLVAPTAYDASTATALFSTTDVPVGAQVYQGQRVGWELTPSQIYRRDRSGAVDVTRLITVQSYEAHVNNSGFFTVEGTSPYRGTWEYETVTAPISDNPTDPLNNRTFTGVIDIPWGERADWSTLRLYGDDVRPVTIYEITWTGQVLSSRGASR